jgi:flagellar biosynthetic protein FliP
MATKIAPPKRTSLMLNGHRGHFLRHLVEMAVVMMIGMMAGAAVFTVGAGFAAGESLTWDEARLRYPAACLLVIAAIMSAPMVAWMRHRGHGWQSGAEMTAAMLVPALALIGLFWWHVIGRDPLCGVYCAVMVPAMVAAMLLRRQEYGGTASHHAVGHA